MKTPFNLDALIDISDKADFERVLAHYDVRLRGSKYHKAANCPFHPGMKGQLKADLRQNTFYCTACSHHGNVLDFVQQIEGIIPLSVAAAKVIEICNK